MVPEAFASSATLFVEHTHDGVGAVPAVVLPHADSRQPQSDALLGAEQPDSLEEESTQIGNLVTTFGSRPPQPPSNKFKPHHAGASTSRVSKDGVVKVPRIRGTRGRGDPRNARMREDRLRAQMAGLGNAHPNPRVGLPHQTIAFRGRGQPRFHEVHRTEPRFGGFAHRDNEYENFAHAPRPPAAMRRTPQQQITIDIHGPPSSTGRPTNGFQRPPPLAMHRALQVQQGPEHRRPGDDWTQWIELGIKLSGLPSTVTTFDLWQSFRREGSIATVEIFEDNQGKRDGKGRVRFRYSGDRDCSLNFELLADLLASPPPAKPFWQATRYQISIKGMKQLYLINVELDAKRRLFLAPSPVNPSVKYPENTV